MAKTPKFREKEPPPGRDESPEAVHTERKLDNTDIVSVRKGFVKMILSLYEMSQEWENVFEMLLDPEIPEEAVFDTIEMIEADMDIKADGYAKIIKSMDGDAAQIDAEIKRLQDRKAAVKNRQAALKQRLFDTMKATGRTNFKTALFSFNIQKNGGVKPVELQGEVPAAWLKPGAPDTTKIREYLEAGNSLPFATLGDRGESLRIR